jgi:hypothetical protein
VKLTTHLHLEPSKKAWSYTSIPQYIFLAWCLVKHRATLPYLTLEEVSAFNYPGSNVCYKGEKKMSENNQIKSLGIMN